MILHYSLIVVVVSDVKFMSSTVAVIFAIKWVVNNYNIQTEPIFLTEPNQTHSESNPVTESKANRNKKSIPHIPIRYTNMLTLFHSGNNRVMQ